MNKCEKCGFLHYRTDPCRAAKKSGASVALASNDRVHDPAAIHLTVQPKASVAAGRVGQKSTAARKDVRVTHLAPEGDTKPERNSGRSLKSVAGTQALPVDTPKRGRPSTGFDKRAYNKQYMADRRAGKR